jgi:protein-L-isoaspartate(D-aspartate) O-methyltransferase
MSQGGPRSPSRFPARLKSTAPAVHQPQRAVQNASVAAPARASGMGLDSQAMRNRLVRLLRNEGVRDERVLQAIATVERHLFVDAALVAQAYEDTSLPIGLGQTISKPSVVARMAELAALAPGRNRALAQPLGRVLEIGTGCGYQAAVLCQLARHVVSIERLRPLFDKASTALSALRDNRLRLVYGDGLLGHAPNAPYDTIVCAAGGDHLPQAWLQQLVDRDERGWSRSSHEIVQFVPLRSGIA